MQAYRDNSLPQENSALADSIGISKDELRSQRVSVVARFEIIQH